MADLLARPRFPDAKALLEVEGLALLDAIGIATPRRIEIASALAAADLPDPPLPGDRAVLKALGPGLLHKTEVGAVRVVSARRFAVLAEALAMERRLEGRTLAGFVLEEYVPHETSLGSEFLLGLRATPDFGPVVTLGAGGVHAEFLARALREGGSLAVFSDALRGAASVEETLERLAPARLATRGHRGLPAALPIARLADAVRRFLALAAAFCPQPLREFEVNPLVVSAGRLVALDALATLGADVLPDAPARPVEKIRRLLEPRTIAIVGVSETAMNPGRIILRNVLRAGFDPARVVVVKRGADSIDGCRCVPALASLPEAQDVVVLAVSAAASAGLIEEIARDRRAESVVLIPGGLEENPESAPVVATMRQALDRSRGEPWRGPVVNGGNCLGLRSEPGRIDTLFIPEHKLPLAKRPADPVALIMGSGAFAVSTISKLPRLRPVYTVTVGNQMDLTAGDYLEYLKGDPRVEIFAVYLEGFRPGDGARFLAATEAIVASGRPVILYRGGRSPSGAAAAASHTAAVAGDYRVTTALAEAAGAIVAETLEDFGDLVRLAVALRRRSISGLALGAISNAGYETVAIADNLGPFELARFSDETRSALGAVIERAGLAGIASVRNPLDLTPILDDAATEAALRTVLADPGVAVALLGCVPLTGALATLATAAGHGEDIEADGGIVKRLIRLASERGKAWIAVVDSGPLYDPMVRALEEGGVPTFRSADRATRLFGRLCAARCRFRVAPTLAAPPLAAPPPAVPPLALPPDGLAAGAALCDALPVRD
ncbi:MAG TPA: acetate--CoA ligase family protein [Candidatus Eisenbacteria bacterium]